MTQQQLEIIGLIEKAKQESGKSIVLVEFYGQTCSLCKFVWSQLQPVLNNLPDPIKDRVTSQQIDVMVNPKYAIHYGIKVIPSIVLFVIKDGVEQDPIKFEKPISIPDIKEKIIEVLK